MIDITPDDTVFFLHIPKTAGTSLRIAIESRFDQESTCPIYRVDDLHQHPDPATYLASFRFIRGHMLYARLRSLLSRDPITLTMLRDPIDRFVSHWAFLQTHILATAVTPERKLRMERVKTISLEQFAEETSHGGPEVVYEWQSNIIGWEPESSEHHAFKAYRLRSIPNSTVLACAKQRLAGFAWFGLTERYHESLALLAYTFGWLPPRTVAHHNVTRRRPKLAELAPALRDTIASFSRPDQELYEFAAGLFDERYHHMCHDLLQRYGGKEHAHLTPPIAPEILVPLLEQHFVARFAAQSRIVPREVVRLDTAFEGAGWHNVEYTAAGEPYRWSGPDRVAHLALPLAPGPAYNLQFRVVHALSVETLHSLQLTVNGALVPLQCVAAPDGATHFDAIIPAAAITASHPFALLGLQVDRTIRPDGDDRVLGLAFGTITVSPVGAA